MSKGPLSLLRAVAQDFGAHRLSDGDAFEVPVREASGETRVYHIAVVATGDLVYAKEVVPSHLPAVCPDRHIMQGGTFCTFWGGHESGGVVGESTARQWWARLLAFLKAQRRAERARRWTAGKTWAHGPAAVHQQAAEKAAAALGMDFERDLDAGALAVEWSKHRTRSGDRLLYLQRKGRTILTARGSPLRIVNRRTDCICAKGDKKRHRHLRGCGRTRRTPHGHAGEALTLMSEMLAWREEEALFWSAMAGTRCCGTMDSCPLSRALMPSGRSENGTDLEKAA